jgi:hypothetical protein
MNEMLGRIFSPHEESDPSQVSVDQAKALSQCSSLYVIFLGSNQTDH